MKALALKNAEEAYQTHQQKVIVNLPGNHLRQLHVVNSSSIAILSATDLLQPLLLTGSTKAMPCAVIYLIIQVNNSWQSVIRVEHCVPLASFCLSLYTGSLHVLNRTLI